MQKVFNKVMEHTRKQCCRTVLNKVDYQLYWRAEAATVVDRVRLTDLIVIVYRRIKDRCNNRHEIIQAQD